MTTSTSRLAYHDCIAVFDRAMADDFGCRVRMKDRSAAINFRMRMHTARELDRRDNKQLYAEQPDHQLYGRSVYDTLIAKIRHYEGSWWIYVQKMRPPELIEDLSELPEDAREVGNMIETEYEEIKEILLPAPPQRLLIEPIKRRV